MSKLSMYRKIVNRVQNIKLTYKNNLFLFKNVNLRQIAFPGIAFNFDIILGRSLIENLSTHNSAN